MVPGAAPSQGGREGATSMALTTKHAGVYHQLGKCHQKRWFQPCGDLSIKKGGSILKRASNSDCLTDKNFWRYHQK